MLPSSSFRRLNQVIPRQESVWLLHPFPKLPHFPWKGCGWKTHTVKKGHHQFLPKTVGGRAKLLLSCSLEHTPLHTEAHWHCGCNHRHQVFHTWSSNVFCTFHKKRTGMCGCRRATTQTKKRSVWCEAERAISNHHHLEHAKYRQHQPNKVRAVHASKYTIQIKSKRPAFQADTFVVVQNKLTSLKVVVKVRVKCIAYRRPNCIKRSWHAMPGTPSRSWSKYPTCQAGTIIQTFVAR